MPDTLSHQPAPVVDAKLARFFACHPNPLKLFHEHQPSARFLSSLDRMVLVQLSTGQGRLVRLACGHFTVTKVFREAPCPRCGEMIRAGYAYTTFHEKLTPDEFSWPGDPLLSLHEQGTVGELSPDAQRFPLDTESVAGFFPKDNLIWQLPSLHPEVNPLRGVSFCFSRSTPASR
jgi:hypothetical protein